LGWRLSIGRPFEGDVAIKVLCHRLSIDPDFVPCPPAPQGRNAWFAWLGLAGLFAVVTYGIIMVTTSDPRALSFERSGSAPDVTNQTMGAIEQPVRLVIERRQPFANEPLPIGVSLDGGAGRGVAPGAR
jgi:hypothetical protein